MRIRRVGLLVLLLTLVVQHERISVTEAACDGLAWTNPNGGLWVEPSNWSDNRAPTASDAVCIESKGAQVVLGAAGAAATLTIGQDSTLVIQPQGSGNASLAVTNFVINAGTLVLDSVDSAGTSALSASGAAGITNASTGVINVLRGTGGSPGQTRNIAGSLSNNGIININHRLLLNQAGTHSPIYTNNGAFKIAAGTDVAFGANNTGNFVFNQNTGSLEIGEPDAFTFRGAFNFGGGFIPLNAPVLGGSLNFAPGALVAQTVFIMANCGCQLLNDIPAGAGIRVQGRATGGATLTVNGNLTNNGGVVLEATAANANATLATSPGGSLTNASTGILTVIPGAGGGTRSIVANLNNAGTIAFTHPLTFSAFPGGATATISNTGVFAVGAGAAVTLAGGVRFNQDAGSLDIRGPDAFTVRGGAGGALTYNGGSIPDQPPLLSAARLSFGAAPPAGGTFVMISGGELGTDIPAGQVVEIQGRTGLASVNSPRSFTNSGAIVLSSIDPSTNGQLVASSPAGFGLGTITNASSGTIRATSPIAGSHAIIGSVVNLGTVDVDQDLTQSSGNFTNAGALIVRSATFTVRGAFIQTAGSTSLASTSSELAVPAGATIQGGSLSGIGAVTGNVSNAGRIIPGASPGLLTVNGSYVQSSGGVLEIEIGGRVAGSQYDRLAVTGAATLGGTLAVNLIDGFSPADGDAFQVVTHGSGVGAFRLSSGGGLVGRTVSVNYGPAAATLTIGSIRIFLPLARREP